MPSVSERASLLRNAETPRLRDYEEFGNFNENVVSWDDGDDPANPMNWTEGKKWAQVAIVAVLTFLVSVESLRS